MKIKLDPHLADFPTLAADTLLHEILHVLYWVHDLTDGDKEERIVTCLATGLTQVFIDNPWLSGWMKDRIRGGAA